MNHIKTTPKPKTAVNDVVPGSWCSICTFPAGIRFCKPVTKFFSRKFKNLAIVVPEKKNNDESNECPSLVTMTLPSTPY